MRTTECRDCGADIIWAVTVSGSNIPLDARPFAGAKNAIETLGDGTLLVHLLSEKALGEHIGDRYRVHFASCKNRRKPPK